MTLLFTYGHIYNLKSSNNSANQYKLTTPFSNKIKQASKNQPPLQKTPDPKTSPRHAMHPSETLFLESLIG